MPRKPIHTGDRQELLDRVVLHHGFSEHAVDRLQVVAKPIQFPESLLDPEPLVQ
jgi:hypothetical protein